jgi:hypothetical protein
MHHLKGELTRRRKKVLREGLTSLSPSVEAGIVQYGTVRYGTLMWYFLCRVDSASIQVAIAFTVRYWYCIVHYSHLLDLLPFRTLKTNPGAPHRRRIILSNQSRVTPYLGHHPDSQSGDVREPSEVLGQYRTVLVQSCYSKSLINTVVAGAIRSPDMAEMTRADEQVLTCIVIVHDGQDGLRITPASHRRPDRCWPTKTNAGGDAPPGMSGRTGVTVEAVL